MVVRLNRSRRVGCETEQIQTFYGQFGNLLMGLWSLKYYGVAILFSVGLNRFADTSTNGPRPIRTRELKPPACWRSERVSHRVLYPNMQRKTGSRDNVW